MTNYNNVNSQNFSLLKLAFYGSHLMYYSDDCGISLCKHLQEHLKDFTGDDMSLDSKNEEEIEFHYFKLHDYDDNNKLGVFNV